MQLQRNSKTRRLPTGIAARHSRKCRSRSGGSCNCEPSYRAFVYDRRRRGQGCRGKHDRSRSENPQDVPDALRGEGVASRCDQPGKPREADRAKHDHTQPGSQRMAERRGSRAANSAHPQRCPLQAFRTARVPAHPGDGCVLPDLGSHRLSDIRRSDLQALVDRLVGGGKSGSTVHNVVMPIRVLFRRALEDDQVAVNPTSNLRPSPNAHKVRERAASATEAAALLDALPRSERALWATAFYAGLRRGELRAIRWADIDLAAGIIHVSRGWDDVAGEIAPKSAKGTRTVPSHRDAARLLDRAEDTYRARRERFRLWAETGSTVHAVLRS